ncbi:MAG: magnesium transporter, partial [Flavobacteriales bacterium]
MAEFNVNKAFLEDIRSAIDARQSSSIKDIFGELHPSDIAETLYRLSKDEAIFVFSSLDEEQAAETLTFLDEEIRPRFMQLFTPTEIAERVIDNLDSDDAADIISALPEEQQKEVLSKITDFEQAKDIADLLGYDEDSAGGLMAKELVKVHLENTLIQCVREIRKQAEELDDLYAIYVVDDRDILVGLLPLKRLLLAPTTANLQGIIDNNVVSVMATATREDVAAIMEKYDLVVLPVVDELGRLMGRITIDDVVDVIKEEAERDYQLASGISEDVEADDKVWVLSRARLPWLLIGLVGGIAGSRIIGAHEST